MVELGALFALGGLGFWFLLAIYIFFEILAIEYESTSGATLTLVGFFTIVFCVNGFNPFMWVLHNPLLTVGLIIGYFLTGTAWSVAKWYFYVLNKANRLKDLLPEVLRQYNVDALAKLSQQQVAHLTQELKGRGLCLNAPRVAKHKSLIMMWMAYWPFSMSWTLINDPVKKAFRAIYNRLANTLQNISDSVFKKAFE
jgi:hypothetical protein